MKVWLLWVCQYEAGDLLLNICSTKAAIEARLKEVRLAAASKNRNSEDFYVEEREVD